MEHASLKDESNNEGGDMDNSDVPIASVIHKALRNGLDHMPLIEVCSGIASSEHTAVHEGGFLRVLAKGNDIWAWDVNRIELSTQI